MRKTFKYRLHPTPAQERALLATLDECRWLYNHLLDQRKTAYEERGETLGLYDQQATLVPLKGERPSLAGVHSQVLQNVAVRIDLAFKAFFRRVKAGEKPGFPRFRGRDRFDSFCYPQSGYKATDRRVYLSGIGHIKAILHRPLEGKIKTCCVRRGSTGKWYVAFSCEVDATPLPVTDTVVGIDVGLEKFATLHDAAWRQFIAYLTYKAEDAGRHLVTVNPAYTSQTCSRCGHRARKELSERVHRCSCCGLVLDRDQNAALNILALGLQSLA